MINRLLIETYSVEMTAVILEQVPGAHIIYGIDDLAGEGNSISAKQIAEVGAAFVSFPWRYRLKDPERLRELTQSGLTVLSRTMDNLKEDVLREAGVSIILLDIYYNAPKKSIPSYIYMRRISHIWLLVCSACKREVKRFLSRHKNRG